MRTVIWDMGGTLVDTYPEVDRALGGVVWPEGLSDLHLAEVRELRTRSIAHAIDILSTRYEVDPALFHRALEDLARRWETRPAPLMEGAADLMSAAHRAGGLNLVATHRDRASAEALLGALHVHVDDLVSVSDGYARKPDPQMYEVLLARHGVAVADALAVGDRVIDIRAGEVLGVRCALLVPSGTPAPGTEGLHPLVARSLRELVPLVTPSA